MISGVEGHTQFQSFKLSKEEQKGPKFTWEHFAKSMGRAFTQGNDGVKNYQSFVKNPVRL